MALPHISIVMTSKKPVVHYFGVAGEIRTLTGLPPPAPQAGVSTVPPRPQTNQYILDDQYIFL